MCLFNYVLSKTSHTVKTHTHSGRPEGLLHLKPIVKGEEEGDRGAAPSVCLCVHMTCLCKEILQHLKKKKRLRKLIKIHVCAR